MRLNYFSTGNIQFSYEQTKTVLFIEEVNAKTKKKKNGIGREIEWFQNQTFHIEIKKQKILKILESLLCRI